MEEQSRNTCNRIRLNLIQFFVVISVELTIILCLMVPSWYVMAKIEMFAVYLKKNQFSRQILRQRTSDVYLLTQ